VFVLPRQAYERLLGRKYDQPDVEPAEDSDGARGDRYPQMRKSSSGEVVFGHDKAKPWEWRHHVGQLGKFQGRRRYRLG
jgi:hypothetical protein